MAQALRELAGVGADIEDHVGPKALARPQKLPRRILNQQLITKSFVGAAAESGYVLLPSVLAGIPGMGVQEALYGRSHFASDFSHLSEDSFLATAT